MADHVYTLGVVILIALCALLIHTIAVLAEEEHDHSKMGATGLFYQTWMRPKGDFTILGHRQQSCCNRSDCSPVIELQTRNGELWARVELRPEYWYRVPRPIIESNQIDPRESPDHRAHACVIDGRVVCYVEGAGI
jgi:hypothetical protein